jgi:hypothetical protein
MSHNDDAAVQELIRKIDRENAIINAARQMSQATNNPAVSSRVDSQIREATRNINYFEQTLRDIQTRQMGNLSVSGAGRGSGPMPPQHGMSPNGQSGRGSNNQSGYDTQQADYGAPRRILCWCWWRHDATQSPICASRSRGEINEAAPELQQTRYGEL